MANEITAVTGHRDPDSGNVKWSLFLLFPVDTGVGGWRTPAQVGGANVVPTPANEGADPANPSLLPDIVDAVITAGERSALNDGTAVYRLVQFQRPDGMTGAELATRAQAMYAAMQTTVQAEYDTRYEFSGSRIDA